MTTLQTTETRPAASEPLTTEQRKQLDVLCADYEEARARLDDAKDEADMAKARLLEFIQLRGYVPAGAEKSQRCDGLVYVATRTVGNTIDLDAQQILKLQLALSAAKCSGVFPQLFTSRTEYTMQKDAGQIIESAALPSRRRAHILGVFGQCFRVKGKTPSLTVETLQAAQAKAAKSASKKGGK